MNQRLSVRFILRWGAAILVMAVIYIASSTPGSDIPYFGYWDYVAKKGGHLFGYALLGAAYLHGLGRRVAAARHRIWMAAILVALYAASDEWHQSFTPGRHPSFMDIGIDLAGGILGIAAAYVVRKAIQKEA